MPATFKPSASGNQVEIQLNGTTVFTVQQNWAILPLLNYANDAAAAAAGVPVGGMYHTAGAVKVRLV